MTPKPGSKRVHLTSTSIAEVRHNLEAGRRVRVELPGNGRLSLDRPLPFLLVHRRPATRRDAGTDQLILSEAAVLTVSARHRHHDAVRELVRTIGEVASQRFGAFFLLEVWSAHGSRVPAPDPAIERAPSFAILRSKDDESGDFLDAFQQALSRVKIHRLAAKVVVKSGRTTPPRMPPLLDRDEIRALNCTSLALEVVPLYQNAGGAEVFPLVLRSFRRPLSQALRRTLYRFARTRTTHRPAHFHVLGKRALVKAVWEVDGRLAHVGDSFDFLLMVSPANSQSAWNEFRRSGYERMPTLHYRHLPFDPAVLKRSLFQIPIERVDDPAMHVLLREKQRELDRQITMLADRNTRKFLAGSRALYGPLREELLTTARDLLARFSPRARDDGGGPVLDAKAFAARAAAEIAHYQAIMPKFQCEVQLRDDIASGLMVSRGRLLIGRDTRIPEARVDALLQHEVGTHVVTYTNGAAQPFQQLRSGLADYDSTQEGLAVLAEYLSGGLSRPRLRLLAGRVMAAESLLDGASFVETFRLLRDTHGFRIKTAFTITLRVHRGGGLTKDAFYLDGLMLVLKYLANQGDVTPLLYGKMHLDHVPIIRELHWRKVLRDPPLIPRYLETAEGQRRLEQVRAGIPVAQLTERQSQ